ncbi:MAG: uracil-DNA glycosylase [Gammaproteobacteria bacterium]|nr:uracil-DNA glycosylase [Gammaproteobacteria bacterium]
MDKGRTVQMEHSWLAVMQSQFQSAYMQKLRQFLLERKKSGAVIYPLGEQYFSAFNTTSFNQVKVVILGQDPYHGPGQAHGLCFSVLPNVPPPPSLINIFKEIQSDLGIASPNHGCLIPWAEQGVFLLNAVLTVEKGRAGAHQGKGWELFTDYAIQQLSEKRERLVFLLWGSYAQKKGQHIDSKKHLVLKCAHPSPLSAHRGFLGCQHFSQTNTYLQAHGQQPVDWQLPDKMALTI